MPQEEFGENQTGGKLVDSSIDGDSGSLFRRHVLQGSFHAEHTGPRSGKIDSSHPEVHDLELPFSSNHQVAGLDVPVHEAQGIPVGIGGHVGEMEPPAQLDDEIQGDAGVKQATAPAQQLDDPPKFHAFQVLHDEQVSVWRFDKAVNLDDVGVTESAANPSLEGQAFHLIRIVHHGAPQPLYGHRPAVARGRRFSSQEHLAETPFAQGLEHFVAAKLHDTLWSRLESLRGKPTPSSIAPVCVPVNALHSCNNIV